ncbi:AzlD family protein [Devosia aquimaris]|uniref:AzlD family protein n=1 Tax=Devosia aquimaris TaxID=2866214 RepID=UPI001CD186F4|nr:AzlD domain-containing protein [Devosia sp. CJK-A8-3]
MWTSPQALAAILGMALVSFAVKALGLLLANRLPRHGFAAAWLRHVPGAVLASLVAPALATGNPAELLAALATALMYWRSRSLILSMATGVLAVYVARLALAG